MASVIQRGSRWYLKFRDETGRWQRQPCSATTKTEARRLATELEQKAERRRLGLEAMPNDSGLTFAELCQWWLDNRCPTTSLKKEKSRLTCHVFTNSLGKLPL